MKSFFLPSSLATRRPQSHLSSKAVIGCIAVINPCRMLSDSLDSSGFYASICNHNNLINLFHFIIQSGQGGHRVGQGHFYRGTGPSRPPYRTAYDCFKSIDWDKDLDVFTGTALCYIKTETETET